MADKKKPMIVLNEQNYPHELVCLDLDGGETHWRYHRTSTVQRQAREVQQNPDDGEYALAGRWDQCEWLVRSQYRESRCGRGGYDDGYGMALCWQHQDMLMQNIIHRLRNKQWPCGHISDLVEALVATPWVPGPYSGLPPSARLLEAQLADNIDNLIDNPGVVSDRVKELVDRLIDRRLAERMGTTHEEEDSDDDE